jgi:hypothetical protein
LAVTVILEGAQPETDYIVLVGPGPNHEHATACRFRTTPDGWGTCTGRTDQPDEDPDRVTVLYAGGHAVADGMLE